MASEALGPDSPADARHDAASAAASTPLTAPTPSTIDASAIGYEAADPALQALWTAAMDAAAPPR
jgi:hypothetical protein